MPTNSKLKRPSVAATTFAKQLIEDKEYQSQLGKRLRSGELPPAVEAMLWHYAYGKPVESIDINHHMEELENLSDEELLQVEDELKAMPTREDDDESIH
jgi:hypothetical protein